MNLTNPYNVKILFGICFIIFFMQTIVLADVSFSDSSYVKVEPEFFYFNYWEVNDNHDLFMKEYGLMKGVSLTFLTTLIFYSKLKGNLHMEILVMMVQHQTVIQLNSTMFLIIRLK